MILRARTSVIYVENRYATVYTYSTTTRLDTLTLDVARFLEIKNDFARRTSVTYVGNLSTPTVTQNWTTILD